MVTLCIRLLYMTLAWSVAAAAPSLPRLGAPAGPKPLPTYKTSWYGPRFHGRLTANGEVFDMNELTAAHRDIPFGTQLRVTCPENGLSVLVRINDRGPFIEGRDLDLSLAAARGLGIEEQGLAWVRMEAVVN
jgi:rare lipoprotein A